MSFFYVGFNVFICDLIYSVHQCYIPQQQTYKILWEKHVGML